MAKNSLQTYSYIATKRLREDFEDDLTVLRVTPKGFGNISSLGYIATNRLLETSATLMAILLVILRRGCLKG